MKTPQIFYPTAYWTYGTLGPMKLMRLICPTDLISPISETHRILILGPSATDHQLQNVLRRRGAAADHVLFNFIRDHICLIRWPRSLHFATV